MNNFIKNGRDKWVYIQYSYAWSQQERIKNLKGSNEDKSVPAREHTSPHGCAGWSFNKIIWEEVIP